MIRLTTNFEFNSDMPLDYRMNFETIDEMLDFPKTDVPLGLLSTVKANRTTYQFVGEDIYPSGKGWKEVFREGNFLVTADGIEYKNPNTGSTAVTVQAGIDELRRDLNNHVENCLWKEPLSSSADLPPIGKAVNGEAHVVGGRSIYVFDGTQWVDLIDTHIINDATISNSGLMSAGDKIKVDKIIISEGGDKFLANDGTYKTISGSISDDEKGKINKIITTGDGSKFLSDDGTYKTVSGISAQDQAKIDKLVINGDANKFLAADGTYKSISGTVPDDVKEKVEVVVTNGDGKSVLANDGTYKAPATLIDLAKADTAVGANDGNDGLMSKEDKAKVDVIQVSANPGDENLFLAKDGTYKAVSGGSGSGDGLTQDQKNKLDKIIINNPDGKLFLANDGEYKNIVDFIPVADYATDGLMDKNDKSNLDSLVTQIITTGDGSKFLNNHGEYVEVTGKLSTDDQAKLDKIITNDQDGKLFLANDGNYKNVTPFVDIVTTLTDGLMKATDKVSLDKVASIVKDDAGETLFLAGDGTYKTVVATATTIAAANTTYDNTKANKLTSTNVQDAIDEILTDMPSIDDTAASTDFTKLLSAGKIYDLLDKKANKTHTHVCADITDLTSKYYDIKTIDQKIADVTTGVIWKESVATYTDIATTYPSPETGWLVATLDTQQIYRYNGTTWEKFGSMAIQSEATHTEKGLMSAADKVKLDSIDENAPRIYYQSATPPLINGTIWVEE